MKKFLALLLALVMVLALAACGETATTTTETTEATETTETAETAETTEPAEPAADVKIGFIFLHDEQSTYDLNFMNGAKEACEELGIEYVMKVGIPEGQECYEAAMDLVDEGCNIVFADSFGHEDYMIQAAKECPDVQFCHATGTKAHTEGLDNYHNAFASIYEGRYLAGIAAGMKIKEMIDAGKITAEQAKIGYVGAYTYAEVISGYTSFFLGVRSIVPEATMEVTFTGSWYDMALETEGAQKLIDDGCVLISQHADSLGAPSVCEANGVPNVSYNGSTIDAGPNTFIVSSRINWAPYFKYIITQVQNGEAIDTDWTGTLATGSVELTDVNETVAAEGTAEAIEAAKAELEAGTLHVFDTATFTATIDEATFTNTKATLDADGYVTGYMADVDTDAEYAGDTEVIADGYFHESEYRSAPYFDMQIDGITLLDTKF